MKHYKQIKKEERNELSILLNRGYGIREIAKVLDRSPSTISREVKRNCRQIRCCDDNRDGPYEPSVANHKAYVKRKYAKYQGKKIRENSDLLKFIRYGLEKHWSPDEISGRMKLEGQPFYVSKTTIYEYCYSAWGQNLCHYLPSKRYNRKRQRKQAKKITIPERVGIELRPKEVSLRSVFGHFEEDTIVSGKAKRSNQSLAILYERLARYVDIERISCLKPAIHNQAILKMTNDILKIKSITFDNGIENQRHTEIRDQLNINTYFCDPYSSWQKGGVENVNKMIRRFIPKGSDISDYSNKKIRTICNILNNKPRKSLGYKTPMEIMFENNLLKDPTTKKNSRNCCNLYDTINIKKRAGVALRG